MPRAPRIIRELVNSMTTITVKFFAALREISGKKEVKLRLKKEEGTVQGVLDELSNRYGENFKEYVFDPRNPGSLRSQISIMVNGQSIRDLEDLKTRIKDGDVIAMLPPVSGG